MVTVMTCVGAVGRRHRDAVGVVVAPHELVVGVVHRVGPGPGRVDRELAVAVAAGHVGLRHEGARAVHVGGSSGCRRCVCAALVSVSAAVLVAGDHRRVVGAVDGDGDDLLGAVGRRHRDAVGVVAARPRTRRGRCSSCRSTPRPHRSRTCRSRCAGRVGLRHEGRRAVHVGGVELAAGRSAPHWSRSAPPSPSPVITAASLVPLMVTVMTCSVPSAVATVTLSV